MNSVEPPHQERITDFKISAHSTWNALSEVAELIEPKSTNRADFIKECQSGALDSVLVAYRTFGSVEITGLWDEGPSLPPSLYNETGLRLSRTHQRPP